MQRTCHNRGAGGVDAIPRAVAHIPEWKTASGMDYSGARRKRNALAITDTELKLIAAAAKMGLSVTPKNG